MKQMIWAKDGPHYLEQIDLVQLLTILSAILVWSERACQALIGPSRKDRRLGIVGRTGAGKTTLVRQFLQQYQLVRESFFGQPATDRELQPTLHRRKIGYVSQEHIYSQVYLWI